MSARGIRGRRPTDHARAGPGLTIHLAGTAIAWDNVVGAIRTALDQAAPHVQDDELARLAGQVDARSPVTAGHRTFSHSLGSD